MCCKIFEFFIRYYRVIYDIVNTILYNILYCTSYYMMIIKYGIIL